MTNGSNLQEMIFLLEHESLSDADWSRLHNEAVEDVAFELARCAEWLKLENARLPEAYGHSESCGNLISVMEKLDDLKETRHSGELLEVCHCTFLIFIDPFTVMETCGRSFVQRGNNAVVNDPMVFFGFLLYCFATPRFFF